MDDWKFFAIAHEDHLVCNPTSEAKLDRLVDLVRLSPGDRVLEIAAGKGELTTRLVERWGVGAVAVDLSPYFCRDLRRKLAERVPDAEVAVLEMDGAAYRPDEPRSFDLTLCLGASWIFGGHAGTLRALAGWTRPGGQIAVGEPYWRRDPSPELLAGGEHGAENFGSLWGNVETARGLGLRLTHLIDSSLDDWDRYYALWWHAADRWARAHGDDPDLPEVMRRIDKQQEDYLRWERADLGWAIYLFRAADEPPAPESPERP